MSTAANVRYSPLGAGQSVLSLTLVSEDQEPVEPGLVRNLVYISSLIIDHLA